jgi:outer membrane receptor for ferrienterochelin and colicins
MDRLKYIFVFILFFESTLFAQKEETDANIIGHVVSNGEHLPFATIVLEGTTIGTATDETGHYRIFNLPEGKYTIKAQAVGYKSQEKQVEVSLGKTVEVKFDLKEDFIGIEQVIVSANRNEQSRTEAVTVVNIISPKLFQNTQSTSLGEGLNFTPGLRLETDCQNCGFTQVRMNGMEGAYSQILINSRAIFSGLAGVYGLELFPANMIERVEVVRGGGSVLFGSNAIAGTINLITKDPVKSGFELSTTSRLIGLGLETSGRPAFDNNINFNASVVDLEAKSGLTVYGFIRDRQHFDANGDDFSEISEIGNTTVGTRAYHRTGKRGKITFDYFNIRENRRGGNKFDYLSHEADISESVNHNINTGALSFDQLFNDSDKLSVFASAQHVDRTSYYGAEKDPSAYGHTNDLSYTVGTQLFINRDKLFFAPGNIVAGVENNGGFLDDNKMGYYDEINNVHVDNTNVAKQTTNTTGVFAQAEWTLGTFKTSIGARVDHYVVSDKATANNDVSGTVVSPRLSFKYDITDNIFTRLSYSQGFRAPQIFDEDLHIEVSGSRKVIHKNDPNLKQEDSQSVMVSFDVDLPIGDVQSWWLIEGFYTQLKNPFVNEYGVPDSTGTVIYTRKNAKDGAFVSGINIEWNLAPSPIFVAKTGFTWQISEYEKPREFNEKSFLRTPNTYGFLTIDYDFVKDFCLSLSGSYTGKMLVPYFGQTLPDPDKGELRTSNSFFDLGVRLSYDVKLNGTTMQLSTGVKNIFNSYQSDFDTGVKRDPGYIYGPGTPRTIYFGLKFSNFM